MPAGPQVPPATSTPTMKVLVQFTVELLLESPKESFSGPPQWTPKPLGSLSPPFL